MKGASALHQVQIASVPNCLFIAAHCQSSCLTATTINNSQPMQSALCSCRRIAVAPLGNAAARPARSQAVAHLRMAAASTPQAAASSDRQQRAAQQRRLAAPATLAQLAALWAAAAAPAQAAEALSGAPPASSYYVSLGLFVMTVPGGWCLLRRRHFLPPHLPGPVPCMRRCRPAA